LRPLLLRFLRARRALVELRRAQRVEPRLLGRQPLLLESDRALLSLKARELVLARAPLCLFKKFEN
jgi:hypothetical protein